MIINNHYDSDAVKASIAQALENFYGALIKKIVKNPLIIDGRNIYDKKELAELGFEYYGIGC